LVQFHNDLKIIGTFDGHGPYGHDASDFVTRRLPQHLTQMLDSGMDIGNALKASFMQTHEDLLRECDETGEFDCALSGTTATVCIVDTVNNKLWSACVGDSRAILGDVVKNQRKLEQWILRKIINLIYQMKRKEL